MTYPNLPFPNHTWRISHHQGVLNPTVLQGFLFAASTYQESDDPAQEINNYVISNNLVPPNIRNDSKQADVWRDYQQLLSELGLMFPTKGRDRIRLTQAGLAFLDGGIGFKDLMTIQAFRWQYPNGHNRNRPANDSGVGNFALQQMEAGILIKPAILVWQVLDALRNSGHEAVLSPIEIERFLVPARSNRDADLVTEAVLHGRRGKTIFQGKQTKQRRNSSDWVSRLNQTHAFQILDGGELSLSGYSQDNDSELRGILNKLLAPHTFWVCPQDNMQATSWYLWYGTLDSDRYPLPTDVVPRDFGSSPEPEDDFELSSSREVKLKPYEWQASAGHSRFKAGTNISAVYSADLSNSAHRLHDAMVRLIAETCRNKNAAVHSDPATVDLLVQHSGQEILIEVKSATSQNIARKVRGALGQVTYYDYLRSKQCNVPRRKAVALTLNVAESHWCKDFVSDYLDIDLIVLREGRLFVYSQDKSVQGLLGS